MTQPSPSRHCSATNKDGRPCQAWAIHHTDPPLCASHSHRAVSPGPPPGSQNHLIHGFYSRILRRDELTDLPLHPNVGNLKDEIALTRAAIRRLAEKLDQAPDLHTTATLSTTFFNGVRALGRLLTLEHQVFDSQGDELLQSISQALDELSTEWGVKL